MLCLELVAALLALISFIITIISSHQDFPIPGERCANVGYKPHKPKDPAETLPPTKSNPIPVKSQKFVSAANNEMNKPGESGYCYEEERQKEEEYKFKKAINDLEARYPMTDFSHVKPGEDLSSVELDASIHEDLLWYD